MFTFENLNKLKVNYVKVINPKCIIGDNGDAILKVLHLNDKNFQEVIPNALDIKEYRKNPSDVLSYNRPDISDILLRKYEKVCYLENNYSNKVEKFISRTSDLAFYEVMNYKSDMGGEFVDLFNDNHFLFVYPALFKLRKNEEMYVTRFDFVNNMSLYKFSLTRSKDIMNTYILSENVG